MRKKERYERYSPGSGKIRPIAETELHYNNPFRTVDCGNSFRPMYRQAGEYDNSALYRDFPTPKRLQPLLRSEYEYIAVYPYPNNKAKHLVGMAQMLVKDFNSQVPGTLENSWNFPVGTQNGKRHPSRSFQQSRHGGRYPRFPRQPPFWDWFPTNAPPVQRRKELVKYIPEANSHCSSLAHPARTVCMPGTYPTMWQLRFAIDVQILLPEV